MTVKEALNALGEQAANSAEHDYCALSEIQTQSSLGSGLTETVLAFENYAVKEDVRSLILQNSGIQPVQIEEELFNDVRVTAY